MVIEFPFIEFETENIGKIFKPFSFVRLEYKNQFLSLYPMLVDSGADITLIPRKTGVRLGFVEPKEGEVKELGGIAGSAPVVYRTMDMRVEDVKFPCRVAWAQTDDVPPVLGRVDVFDKFDIELKQSERKVLFKPR